MWIVHEKHIHATLQGQNKQCFEQFTAPLFYDILECVELGVPEKCIFYYALLDLTFK